MIKRKVLQPDITRPLVFLYLCGFETEGGIRHLTSDIGSKEVASVESCEHSLDSLNLGSPVVVRYRR